MTLSVEVEPAIEDSLRRTALQEGISVEELIQRFLKQQFPKDRTLLSETKLLERINQIETWSLHSQIKALWAKRELTKLTETEEARLSELQEALNTTNTDRWADLAELALRQGKSLLDLAQELGLSRAEVH
ncbi:hypothetical protein [Armatimonas sp.]|uniref:hypothetical protein n=1 Tax=Armatimonas sp. TaxID=1872638 RepID=UPI0037502713